MNSVRLSVALSVRVQIRVNMIGLSRNWYMLLRLITRGSVSKIRDVAFIDHHLQGYWKYICISYILVCEKKNRLHCILIFIYVVIKIQMVYAKVMTAMPRICRYRWIVFIIHIYNDIQQYLVAYFSSAIIARSAFLVAICIL